MKKIVPLLSVGFLFTGLLAARQDDPIPQTKAATDFLFRGADQNRDGFVTREEFLRFVANNPRLQGMPALNNGLFDRLDGNKDGRLTIEEFRRIADQPANAAKSFPKLAAKSPAKAEGDEQKLPPEQVAFFEKKIRPVLAANCYQCHSESQGKVKGGLVLDTREGLRRGGNSGPAVVPGSAKKSLLLTAIRHDDDHLKMPPKQKLPDSVIADFESWIASGAADPRFGKSTKTALPSEVDIAKGREFWSFQKPKASNPPAVKDESWPRSDIDRFLLAGMEGKGLHPVKDADPRMLIRRVTFDLAGLPPTPEVVEKFVSDPRPERFAEYVDTLLADSAFGERWGRHWLDVARFAESSGKQVNFNYPHAWRYRDYVISAFNADKPFDQFIREQIAGDLLPADSPKKQAEQLIATGFLAIGPKDHNERNRLQFEMDLVDEQIDVTTQAFLGLTVACARCHDHKFDPIATQDYYSLAGIFRSTETSFGTVRVIQNANSSSLVRLPDAADVPSALEPLSDARREQITRQIETAKNDRAELLRSGDANGNPRLIRLQTQIATAESQLESYDETGKPKPLAMGVRDRLRSVDSPVFVRGEVDQPAAVVPRGFVRVLRESAPKIAKGSGRLELAEWIGSKENPLTARVIVNRIWLSLFGRGLVPTPDNFGFAGQPPENQALLDSLAVRFMEQGWSVKKLIRQIVLSRAYQLSSEADEKSLELDPDNALVWRMTPRRLDVESIRDGILSISGLFDRSKVVGSPVAKAGEGPTQVLQRLMNFDIGDHRSVYIPIVRNAVPEALSLFDFAEPSLIVAQRATTTVPAQSLYLLNSPFSVRASEALAGRLLKHSGDDQRITEGYLLAFSRLPTESELASAREFIDRYLEAVKNRRTSTQARLAAWSAFGQSLFSSAEFLYVR